MTSQRSNYNNITGYAEKVENKARETLACWEVARPWRLMIVGPSPNGIEFAGKRTTPALVIPRHLLFPDVALQAGN